MAKPKHYPSRSRGMGKGHKFPMRHEAVNGVVAGPSKPYRKPPKRK